MSPQLQSNLNNVPNAREQRSTQARDKVDLGMPLLLLMVLVVTITAVFEYFGIINISSGFGRRGKPAVSLGIWQPAELTDVSESFWAKPYIEDLAQQGIVKGFADGTFRPNQAVNRAEFAAMLQAAFELNPVPRIARSLQAFVNAESASLTGGYTDVSPDAWAGPAIADTTRLGFFSGFSDNKFRPHQPIVRANAIVAIANGLGLTSEATTRDALWFYRDAPQVPSYAKNAVAAATEAGIRLYQSEPPLLQPNQPLTRAEAAVLIHQAIKQSQQ